jgi:antitoxin VapB
MPLNIKDDEAHALARRLAKATGETITEAVTVAIRERLRRVEHRKRAGRPGLAERLNEIADRCAKLPVYDDRSPDEIIGYNEYGTFD